MSAIAGVYLGRKTQLASYQYADINQILAKIFDASTEWGKSHYGFYHGRIAGRQGQQKQVQGRFDSTKVTEPWVDAWTRCIMLSFETDPATLLEMHDGDGLSVALTGSVGNAKEILGRQFPKARTPNASAIARVFVEEPWDSFEMITGRIKGPVAFAAFHQGRGGLTLCRDHQPLAVYYHQDWDAYFFASQELTIPKEGLLRLGLEPHTGLQLNALEPQRVAFSAPRPWTTKKGVVLFSGGIDSLMTATKAAKDCHELTLLHVDYDYFARSAEATACEALIKELQHWNPRCHFTSKTVTLTFLKQIGGTLITKTDEDVALDRDSPTKEWLPAKNSLLLSVAASYCDAYEVPYIFLGSNLENAGMRPDTTSEFIDRYNAALDCGTRSRPIVKVPLATMTRKSIVEQALELQAPIDLTWSCEGEGPLHCGQCRPCKMRRSAFAQLGTEDTVEYVP